MKKKIGWIAGVLALVALIGGASVLYNKYSNEIESSQLMTENSSQAEIQTEAEEGGEHTEEAEVEYVMAPDFTVYDAEGNEVKLSDFIGKPTVVNFWASWCGPCQIEMPDFDEMYKEFGEEVNFLMVNMTDGSRETADAAAKFVEDAGYAFPIYYDTKMNAAMTYGVNSLPSTYFIDAEGHAVTRAQGIINAEVLQYAIEMISGEK
jgi:thiol-disulfide isomerase/thioredoxin